MAVRMELSVVSAMAPSSGRSRSKRPTNSAEKCCASAADPPLPQASTLPPLVTHASTACTAAAIGLLKDWAAWYLRSALSMKCCWMRCSSMAGDDNPGPFRPDFSPRQAAEKLVFDLDQVDRLQMTMICISMHKNLSRIRNDLCSP